MDLEITKQNGNVAFAEKEHIYWDVTNDAKYISVTTLIGKFEQEFDTDFWSAYKALEKLLTPDEWKIEKKSLLNTKRFNKEILDAHEITENEFNKAQQDILDTWAEENKKSCERGTAIHAEFENAMYAAGANASLKKFGIGGKFICDKGRNTLDLENGVYPEYLISRTSADGKLRLAGQIDLLVKRGNEIIIVDYKTNKKLDQKSFFDSKTKSTVKMKYPLNTLDDCNFMHYTMQLSTYAWMIEQLNPDYRVVDLIILHRDHSDKETIYHLDYKKDEVIKMLKYYKKQILKEEQRKRLMPIEY